MGKDVLEEMKLPESVKQAVLTFLRSRKRAYIETFDNPVGQKVLSDLAKFCRAHETTFHPDPRMHAVLEGRREVFLRIQKHLQLTEEQLWALHGKHTND
jgi:hypothetical protein